MSCATKWQRCAAVAIFSFGELGFQETETDHQNIQKAGRPAKYEPPIRAEDTPAVEMNRERMGRSNIRPCGNSR